MDLIAAVITGLVIAILGGVSLDRVRGVPKRAEGKLGRVLERIPEETERTRWREELAGVLLESEGRPLKQFRESRELIKAAEGLAEAYKAIALAVTREADVEPALVAIDGIRRTRADLIERLERLSFRERRVLELLRGLGGERRRQVEEVGRRFNIRVERVLEIEAEALRRFEAPAETQEPPEPPDLWWKKGGSR